jgi:hypothetical protein
MAFAHSNEECSECKTLIKSCDRLIHYTKECPETFVVCSLALYYQDEYKENCECCWIGQRKNLKRHVDKECEYRNKKKKLNIQQTTHPQQYSKQARETEQKVKNENEQEEEQEYQQQQQQQKQQQQQQQFNSCADNNVKSEIEDWLR